MNIFYDTEFIELGPGSPLTLLSIGMVREDGAELYYALKGVPTWSANDFVREYVLPHLGSVLTPRSVVIHQVSAFLKEAGPDIALWGFFPSYDHVLLAQLFGTMADMPAWLPQRTNDIAQEYKLHHPRKRYPAHDGQEHNALDDARWTKAAYDHLELGKKKDQA